MMRFNWKNKRAGMMSILLALLLGVGLFGGMSQTKAWAESHYFVADGVRYFALNLPTETKNGSALLAGFPALASPDVVLPRRVRDEEGNVFDLTGITGWSLESNLKVQSIDFSACTELTTIGSGTFGGYNELVSIKFPPNMEDLGHSCFYYIDNLEVVDLSMCRNLKIIPEYAFLYDNNIRELKLPEGLETIKKQAFSYGERLGRTNTRLTALEFPSTLRSIEEEAFDGYEKLAEIVFNSPVAPVVSPGGFNRIPETGILRYPHGGQGYIPGVFGGAALEKWTFMEADPDPAETYEAGFTFTAGGRITGSGILSDIRSGERYDLSAGSTVALKAVPDAGYRFVAWKVSGVVISGPTDPALTFTMPTGDVQIGAAFERIPPVQYTVNVSRQGLGLVIHMNPSRVTAGSSVAALAIPIPWFSRFDHWEINGTPSGTCLIISHKVQADVNIVAVFQ